LRYALCAGRFALFQQKVFVFTCRGRSYPDLNFSIKSLFGNVDDAAPVRLGEK
jgi:hypothetical protein